MINICHAKFRASLSNVVYCILTHTYQMCNAGVIDNVAE